MNDNKFADLWDIVTPILFLLVIAAIIAALKLIPIEPPKKSNESPISPMYYQTTDKVVAYPSTATTHILKRGHQVSVVFQMETTGSPVVMIQKLSGVCE